MSMTFGASPLASNSNPGFASNPMATANPFMTSSNFYGGAPAAAPGNVAVPPSALATNPFLPVQQQVAQPQVYSFASHPEQQQFF